MSRRPRVCKRFPWPEASIAESYRLQVCGRCRAPTAICSGCDRGQIYCSPRCSAAQRRASLRAAGQRYQASHRGRRKHAARQGRYRARQRQAHRREERVTHQGSVPGAVARKVLSPRKRPFRIEPAAGETRCSFCGLRCGPWARLGPLRRPRGRASDSARRYPKGGHR